MNKNGQKPISMKKTIYRSMAENKKILENQLKFRKMMQELNKHVLKEG